jgi:His/Glu/Gln/Arg/opine family amino acid ABC transporter permease subunit
VVQDGAAGIATTVDPALAPRRGGYGIAALAFGAAAVPVAFVARGPAVVLALIGAASAGLELVEVHRVRMREALLGLGLAGAGLALAAFFAARETLDLRFLSSQYFNLRAIEGLGPFLLRGAINTLKLAVIGEVGGVVLGLLIALLVVAPRRIVRGPGIAYVDLFRGTPLLMQLSFIYLALPFVGIQLNVFTAGALGLALNSAAYVAEIFRAGIQSVERGQMEAARGLGMPYRAAMRYVIVPQAVRRVIPPLVNEFVALLKDSSLVSALGATVASRELLRVARDAYSNTGNATPFVAASLIYLLMTIPLTRVVNRLERNVRTPS